LKTELCPDDTSIVIESLAVVLIVMLLLASGLAVIWIPWQILLISGFVGIGIGLLIGVPTGFYYHVLLRRSLLKDPPLPLKWWLHPTRFHDRIKSDERQRIFVYFYLGAAGFFLILIGAFITMLSVVRLW
jgi:hypothetical protein